MKRTGLGSTDKALSARAASVYSTATKRAQRAVKEARQKNNCGNVIVAYIQAREEAAQADAYLSEIKRLSTSDKKKFMKIVNSTQRALRRATQGVVAACPCVRKRTKR